MSKTKLDSSESKYFGKDINLGSKINVIQTSTNFKLHIMSEKTKNIIGWVLCGLVAAAMVLSGIMKLIQADQVVELFGSKALPIGIIEILCVVVFLIPKTNNLGFFLMASYLGGAIATEWVNFGQAPIPGVTLNTLLWIGMYLRKPSIFGLN